VFEDVSMNLRQAVLPRDPDRPTRPRQFVGIRLKPGPALVPIK
jgi:hypothetical protein